LRIPEKRAKVDRQRYICPYFISRSAANWKQEISVRRFTISFLLKVTLFAAVLLYFAGRIHDLGWWAVPGILIGLVFFIVSCIPELLEAALLMVKRGDNSADAKHSTRHNNDL